ncbi:Hypothetical predicted protein [Olea europaea subsp. europaea]|uniref:Uncharacterized protein n=1 Tax=Olea europaea subsp. europaea TaxID=158383 RepID=A0A8S0PAP3_OLEEU|nr:Hypothetical predicted protein [Olea europaea subsp. europaea]
MGRILVIIEVVKKSLGQFCIIKEAITNAAAYNAHCWLLVLVLVLVLVLGLATRGLASDFGVCHWSGRRRRRFAPNSKTSHTGTVAQVAQHIGGTRMFTESLTHHLHLVLLLWVEIEG